MVFYALYGQIGEVYGVRCRRAPIREAGSSLTHPEHTAIRLRVGPPGHERARKLGIEKTVQDGIVQHARIPDGVIAQLSARQFSSSQAGISALGWSRVRQAERRS